MKFAIPAGLLAVTAMMPASFTGVPGGGLPDCTGNTTSYTCEEANGVACTDLGNIFESTDEEDDQVVRKSTSRKWCKTENANDSCSGGAWIPTTSCD